MRNRFLASVLLFATLISAMGFSETAWYQDKPIRSITFEGLKYIGRSELDGLFKGFIGEEFTDDIYWDILQKLYALEYFEDIEPLALPGDANRNSVLLQFTVKEKPVIKTIKFSGNTKIKASELREKTTLKEGDIFNDLKFVIDERALRDYYLEKGYANIRLQSETKINSDGSFTLLFNVSEGKQTIVSSINFIGNNIIATKTLKKNLVSKEDGFLVNGTFKESNIEEDKQALQHYYLERGYIDVSIENVLKEIDTETKADKNLVSLTYIINEGEQYSYGGTTIFGNTIFTTESLLSRIRLKEGDVLNLNKFNEGFQAVADVYFENGYTSNYITRSENRSNDIKRISFEINIIESDRSHIENIIIKDNTKTKDKVIFREITFESGDVFSKSKLYSTVRNLYNLRYFSTVVPDIVQGSEQNLVDVILTVEEQSTASIQFGVTFSGVSDPDTFPISVFLQWEDSNFLGNGQALSSNLAISPDTQSLSLGFTENWFMGLPLSVTFELGYTKKILYANQDLLFPIGVPDPYLTLSEYTSATSYNDAYRMKYDQHSISFGASTGYRWFPVFAMLTLRGGFSTELLQNFYDDVLYRPSDVSIQKNHGSWGIKNSIWSRLSLDDRDLNYDPSKGWFASQQFSIVGLIPKQESEYYLKSETKGEIYFTLLNYPLFSNWNLKFVLAGYSSLAFLHPLTSQEIGETSKLYADGMFLGKGWSNLYSINRGQLLVNHWAELRMPLAPGVISLDYFFEGIAIKEDLTNLNAISLNDYYFSFGPALRFSIPQFPLKLLFVSNFKFEEGKVKWKNDNGMNVDFVLSFNISNL